MKIAVVGATGRTGQQIVQQALDRGYSVKAIVRNPDKLKIEHNHLEVVTGDIFSEDSLTKAFGGCEAVLSAFGHYGFGPFSECTAYSETAKQIVLAMRKNNIKLFIAISSWCTEKERGNPKLLEWFFKPLMIGKLLADMGKMERYMIEECKDIVFIAARPPGLVNGALTDKKLLSVEGQWHPQAGYSMTRADVARFMLDCLESDTTSSKLYAIGV